MRDPKYVYGNVSARAHTKRTTNRTREKELQLQLQTHVYSECFGLAHRNHGKPTKLRIYVPFRMHWAARSSAAEISSERRAANR